MEHLWAILRQGLSFIATVLRVRTNSRSNDQGTYFRESHQEFAAAAGRTYFSRLEMNAKGRLVMAASSQAGLAGLFISSAMSAAADERGLFDFTPLEDAAAREALADLRLAE